MEKRSFLKAGFTFAAAALVSPLLKSCKTATPAAATAATKMPAPTRTRTGAFELPVLPYAFSALEPHIDAKTMEIHHGKHHAAYVANLNKAITDTPYANYHLEDILARLSDTDAPAIRNNGGGHYNHALYWSIMSPDGSKTGPSDALTQAMTAKWGSFDKTKTALTDAAKGVFGSGWAWLCVGADKQLFISTTPNQDNPLMTQFVKQTGTPILGIDVWEHAYYLKNQNRRADYLSSFFNVVNWQEVTKRYEQALKG